MKDLKNAQVEELSVLDMQETEGGVVAHAAIFLAAMAIGYYWGADAAR